MMGGQPGMMGGQPGMMMGGQQGMMGSGMGMGGCPMMGGMMGRGMMGPEPVKESKAGSARWVIATCMFLREPAVMQNMMDGGTMWGMGLGGLIALIILVLVIAALVKYVFFR